MFHKIDVASAQGQLYLTNLGCKEIVLFERAFTHRYELNNVQPPTDFWGAALGRQVDGSGQGRSAQKPQPVHGTSLVSCPPRGVQTAPSRIWTNEIFRAADDRRSRLQITILDPPHHKSIVGHPYNITNFNLGKLHGVINYNFTTLITLQI